MPNEGEEETMKMGLRDRDDGAHAPILSWCAGEDIAAKSRAGGFSIAGVFQECSSLGPFTNVAVSLCFGGESKERQTVVPGDV